MMRFLAVIILSLGCGLCLGGCETIAQDFNELGASLTPTSPREAAIDMFDQYDPDKRREGTLLISNSPFGGTEIYVTAYRDMVENERDPLVLGVAIRALAKHGDSSDARLLAPRLEHENEQVRWEAAKGLQRLHDSDTVRFLLPVLQNEDESSDVRRAAAIALGQYPQDPVFQGLVAALNARQLSVNVAAEQSLETLTGEALGLDPRVWLAWYNNLPLDTDAFAGGAAYMFPTYTRNRTWWEQIAFWSAPPVREQPAPPAGLVSETRRSTYGDNPDDRSN